MVLEISDASWLSGFLDGEGHIGVHPTFDGYHQANVFVRNTHKPSIDHVGDLYSQLGLPVHIAVEHRERGKDSWYLSLTGMENILILANEVSSYSITKTRQWELMKAYCLSRTNRPSHKSKTGSIYSVEEHYMIEEFQQVNKRWTEEYKGV